jgi:hypothetical protein
MGAKSAGFKCLLLVVAVSSTGGPLMAQFERLLDRVPNDANTLIIADVDKLYSAPLAVREKWREKLVDDFTQGRIFVPPHAQRLVLAGRMEVEGLDYTWQLALMDVQKTVSVESIARKEKGYTDSVAGQTVAWSPRGGYIVKLGTNSAGVMFPANRQYLSSWLRGRNGQLSPYLRQVAQRRDKSPAQMIMAMDLEDAVSPEWVRNRMKQYKSLSGTDLQAEALASLMASIKGVTLELTVGSDAQGVVTIEFGRDATMLASVAKPAFLELLSRQGAYIDEFEQWKGAVQGTTFSMRGTLGKSGLLRLSSVVELPSLPLDDSGRDQPKVDAGDPKLYASQAHYKSVQGLLADVRQRKGIEVKSLSHLAMWMDQYARKIDRLPVLSVDQDMQDYSAEIASLLRKMSAGYKGSGIRSGAREAQYHSGVSYTSTYGYATYTVNGSRWIQGERRRVRAEETARASLSAVEIWQTIDQRSAEIRQEMTNRYNVEF